MAGCRRGEAPTADASTAGEARGASAAPRRPKAIDTHVHVGPTEIERLHEIMDEVGIDWALNLSGMWPGGPLEAQLAAAERSGRLLVATTLPWALAFRSPEVPEVAAQLITRAKALGARGLKIEKALGLQVRDPQGRLVPVDSPWLDPIWRTAGEVGLPVLIHTGDPEAFWLPVDEKNERLEELSAHPGWSNHGKPVPSFEELLAQLMRVVKRHPKTTFVSVHFGNRAEDPAWVGRMLDEHPNLYVDLAARVPEIGRHSAAELRALFTRHARRILFATDLGLGPEGFLMLGSFGEEPNRPEEVKPFFEAHWAWLETRREKMPSPTPIQGRWTIDGLGLPPAALEEIYVNNALRLFGPPPKGAALGKQTPGR